MSTEMPDPDTTLLVVAQNKSRKIRSARTQARQASVRMPVKKRIDAIIDTAASLLETKQLADITMSDISAASKIPRTAMYNHFPNTVSIYQELSRRLVLQCWDVIGKTVRKRKPQDVFEMCDAAVDGSMIFLDANPAAGKTLLGSDAHYQVLAWADEFGRVAAEQYRSFMITDWPADAPGISDPFYAISLLQMVAIVTHVRAEGFVSKPAVRHIKLMSRAYLAASMAAEE